MQPPPAPMPACALLPSTLQTTGFGGGGGSFCGSFQLSVTLSPVGSFWKNHPSFFLTRSFNALLGGVVFGKGARQRLALISNVIVNRFQSLAGHPVAALVCDSALTLFSWVCLLLPDLHRGHKTRTATEPKLETDTGGDVAARLIYVWGFSASPPPWGKSSVTCDSWFSLLFFFFSFFLNNQS